MTFFCAPLVNSLLAESRSLIGRVSVISLLRNQDFQCFLLVNIDNYFIWVIKIILFNYSCSSWTKYATIFNLGRLVKPILIKF